MAILFITRPEPAATRFLGQVQLAFSDTLQAEFAPLVVIEPIAAPLNIVPAGIILTSENGAVQAALLGLGRGLTAWCVGDRTAKTATDAGFTAQSAAGNADDVIALLLRERPAGPLLHIRGEFTRGDIAARLTAKGLPCTDLIAYRQRPLPLTKKARAVLAGQTPVVVPLFSPRTASLLKGMGNLTAPLHVVGLSQAVAVAFSGVAVQSITVSTQPDGVAMTAATCRVLATLGIR